MLEKIGYRPEMSRWASARDATLGRVVRVDRGVLMVLSERGPLRCTYGGQLLGLVAADPTHAPCTGDWCVVQDWPDHRVTVEKVLPRRTAVTRSAAAGHSHDQVLCANADLVAVVVSLHPAPVLSKVERLVALAWESGARPLVVLTKSDVVHDAELVAEDVAAVAPGVEVVCSSTVTGAGLQRLRGLVDGRHTLALVGTSGHGKSSLVNALVGAEVLPVRPIRSDGRGRHTSVRRELVVLPAGGAVIDTPGLRGVGLAGDRGLAGTFVDVDALAAHCRFSDCAHRGDPGCAVQAAVEDGTLPLRRLESWRRLQREAAWIASRKDARVRAEANRVWKRRRAGGGGR